MTSTTGSTKNYAVVSAVSRTMALLDTMAGQPEGVTVSQLSQDLGIEISVVSRLLATLEQDGFVQRSSRYDRYFLTFRLASIAYRHLESLNLPQVCLPELNRLAADVGELINLAVVDGDVVRFIAKAEGDQRVSVRGLVGHVAQPDAMATGKAWLAWLDDEARLRVLTTTRSDVPVRRHPDLAELFRELAEVREKGYAIETEASMDDVSAIAAPIWAGEPRQVVGVVTISGPAYRNDRARLESFAPRLLETAQALSDLWPAVFLLRQLHPAILPDR